MKRAIEETKRVKNSAERVYGGFFVSGTDISTAKNGRIRFAAFRVRKRYIACALIFFALTVAASAVYAHIRGRSVETFVTPMNGRIVLLDPGHGGKDAGASANGAVEKELNLEIARLVQGYIEEGGGAAILTRTEDKDTSDPNRAAGTSWKMSDLKYRKKDIENFKADAFVSIHMNKFGQSKYRGAQVFYTAESEESKILGETLQRSVKDVLDDGNTREAKPSKNAIYVLKGNAVPSALIECGFLSNAEEAQLLSDPDYRRRVAWGIYIGIVRFFSR